MLFRASQIHKLTTYRPDFNEADFISAENNLKHKLKSKGIDYVRDKINEYGKEYGFKKLVNGLLKQREKKVHAELDPLPDGARAYIEECWLEHNYGFVVPPEARENLPMIKGTVVEEDAIKILSNLYSRTFSKNIERVSKGSLSGECDIIDFSENKIRDIKCPYSWVQFRKSFGIPNTYKWQLTAYCYLYDMPAACIDYVLMPMPEELYQVYQTYLSQEQIDQLRISDKKINELQLNKRIKTYQLRTDIQEDINFLTSRLVKAEEYYHSLDYETCMKIR